MFLDFASWLQSTTPSVTIQTVTWIVPLTQSVHILTIGVVFVSILLVALRVLGVAGTDERIGLVADRFGPVIGYGLVVMATTGAVLVVGEPLRQFLALSFWLKMGLLVVAVASGWLFLKALGSARSADAPTGVPRTAKAAAIATLALWACIIYLGRAIAYDIEVWESYSLGAPQAAQVE